MTYFNLFLTYHLALKLQLAKWIFIVLQSRTLLCWPQVLFSRSTPFLNHLFKESHKQKLCTWNTIWSLLNTVSKMPVLKVTPQWPILCKANNCIMWTCSEAQFCEFGAGLWSLRPFHTAHVKLLTPKTNLPCIGVQNRLSFLCMQFALWFSERWNSCRKSSSTECYAKAIFEQGSVGYSIWLY